MQAALRTIASDLIRSVGTASIVWAQKGCPACQPSCSCTPPSCPDCVCNAVRGERGPAEPAVGFWILALLLVFGLGFVAGQFAQGTPARRFQGVWLRDGLEGPRSGAARALSGPGTS